MGICQPQPQQNDYRTILPRRSEDLINDSPTINQPIPNRLLFLINRSSKHVQVRKSIHNYLQQDRQQQSKRDKLHSQTTIFSDNTLITQIFYQRQKLIIQKVGEKPAKTRIDSAVFNQKYMDMLLRVNWEKLIHLRINHNNIGNIGCKYLSKAKMVVLQKLGLIQNNIGRVGIMHLSKMCLRNLKQLYLGSNKISQGVTHLIKTPMPKIQYINLQNNSIFGFQIEMILISKHDKLSLIDLTWNKLQNVNEKNKKKRMFHKKYTNKEDDYGVIYSRILTV